MGIDTHSEPTVLLRKDCSISRSEGFAAHNRVLLTAGNRHVIATQYPLEEGFLEQCDAGLSEASWDSLDVKSRDSIHAGACRQLDGALIPRFAARGSGKLPPGAIAAPRPGWMVK